MDNNYFEAKWNGIVVAGHYMYRCSSCGVLDDSQHDVCPSCGKRMEKCDDTKPIDWVAYGG